MNDHKRILSFKSIEIRKKKITNLIIMKAN